jgi:exodeoxyribonuclease VII small subunit
MPTKHTQKNTVNFEASINELEALATALETGDLSLEESLATFEKGIKLTKECQQLLSEAEQKVAILLGEGDDMQLVDFDKGAE